MTITESLASAASVLSSKRGPMRYPEEKPKVPAVSKLLETANTTLADLMQRVPDAALAATLQEPGAVEAFASLKDQIADAEKRVSDLTSAMTAAQAHDDALLRRQKIALHRNTLHGLKRHLARRDEAMAKFSTAMENAINAYRDGIEAAGKAAVQARQIAGDVGNQPGWGLDPEELYKATTAEIMRLSVPWPIRAENAALPPFPYDRDASSSLFDRGELQPLADDLKRRSSELIDTLAGREPSA